MTIMIVMVKCYMKLDEHDDIKYEVGCPWLNKIKLGDYDDINYKVG